MDRIVMIMMICMFLAGCANMSLKEGGLYLNQQTCVGMDDLGVAKVRNQF